MSNHLKHEQITGSVLTHWSDQFPLSVTTIYPGTKIDTADLDEWLDLRIDMWLQRPQRSTAKQVLDVTVILEAFVKQGLDKSRIQELADATRSTISQQTIPIRDYETSGTPVTGYLSFFESETRDLSRNDTNTLRNSMQHLRIICPGIAQQI